jgi:DNA-binding LacI/PurR family transcriptional regulator/DNA-binding transcriptional regulator YhcF (GntR family)
MGRALDSLRREGVLTVRRKQGICVRAASQSPAAQRTMLPHERLKQQIARDIFDGRYRPGAKLPTHAEMQHLYGASYPTIRKALNALQRESMVRRTSRWFGVAAHPHAPTSSVLFIGQDRGDRGLVILHERFRDFMYALARECTVARMKYVQMGVGPDEKQERFGPLMEKMLRSNNVFGAVVWTNGIEPRCIESIVALLRNRNIVVVLLDEIGDQETGPFISDNAVRIFTIAAFSAGAEIGRFLLGLGHRSIVYLSPFHGHVWSRLRYKGLSDAMGNAGMGRAGEFTLEQSVGTKAFTPRPETRAVHEKFSEFGRYLERLMESSPPKLNILTRQEVLTMNNLLRSSSDIDSFSQAVRPLCEKIASDRSITAIVAANDIVAILAKDIVNALGIRIPEDISIVGFDNSTYSYVFDLTSYSFDYPDMARKALSFIERPGEFRKFHPEHTVECRGFIMRRSSVRKVRAGGRGETGMSGGKFG